MQNIIDNLIKAHKIIRNNGIFLGEVSDLTLKRIEKYKDNMDIVDIIGEIHLIEESIEELEITLKKVKEISERLKKEMGISSTDELKMLRVIINTLE